MLVHESDAGAIPGGGPRRISRPVGDGPWRRLDLKGWSRAVRGTPVYPQNRACLGLAEGLAARYGGRSVPVRVVAFGPADRWTGGGGRGRGRRPRRGPSTGRTVTWCNARPWPAARRRRGERRDEASQGERALAPPDLTARPVRDRRPRPGGPASSSTSWPRPASAGGRSCRSGRRATATRPYQSYSSYAGNPLLISPERLAEDGLLAPDDWSDYPDLPDDRVDFDAVIAAKDRLFRRAFGQFRPASARLQDVRRARTPAGSTTYALFMALKESHGGSAWYDWEPGLVTRDPQALARRAGAAGGVDPLLPVRPVRLRPAVAGGPRGVRGAADRPDRRPADLRRPGQRRRLGAARPVLARRPRAGRPAWRASPPTTSRRPASSGATRSTAGTRTRPRGSPGGSAA